MPQKKVDAMSYEEAMTELEEVIAALESNQAPLEELITLFERGQGLAQRCLRLLDEAELKVQQINIQTGDGELEE